MHTICPQLIPTFIVKKTKQKTKSEIKAYKKNCHLFLFGVFDQLKQLFSQCFLSQWKQSKALILAGHRVKLSQLSEQKSCYHCQLRKADRSADRHLCILLANLLRSMQFSCSSFAASSASHFASPPPSSISCFSCYLF